MSNQKLLDERFDKLEPIFARLITDLNKNESAVSAAMALCGEDQHIFMENDEYDFIIRIEISLKNKEEG